MQYKAIQKFRALIERYRDDVAGVTLPLAALTFPVVLGMVGLGTDASLWMSHKRSLQTAADAAVLAGGWELAQDSGYYIDVAAAREAVNNGYDPSRNGQIDINLVEVTASGTFDALFPYPGLADEVDISGFARMRVD